MLTHDEMIQEMLKDPVVKAEYDALEPEFALFDELLKARKRAKHSQADVARRMGTKTPSVARLESGGGSRHHSPTVATLQKYAEAVGCKLTVKLVPLSSSRKNRPKA